jgi:serine/threonine protein kinase
MPCAGNCPSVRSSRVTASSKLIGEGAGGAVYLAEQAESGERVALKVLADELAHDDRFRRRFLRESTIAAGLRHPHVVRILDFGEADGGVYLAMRHIEGADLREMLKGDGPLDPAEALPLVAQVGEALDEATPEASSIVTSSPRTSWSTATARRISATSASPERLEAPAA